MTRYVILTSNADGPAPAQRLIVLETFDKPRAEETLAEYKSDYPAWDFRLYREVKTK